MSIVPIDVTTAHLLKEDHYKGTISKVVCEVKTGEKFNAAGVTAVSVDEWAAAPAEVTAEGEDKGKALKRLHVEINLEGAGMIFPDFYVSERALGFTSKFLIGSGIELTKKGFDPEALVGQPIGVRVFHKVTVDKVTKEERTEVAYDYYRI